MKTQKKAVLVFIYNSFKDPLFYNLLLVYLKILNKNKEYHFYLITHEQDKYKLSKKESLETKENLKEYNIYWFPLKWHSGSFLPIKIYDFIKAFLLTILLRLKYSTSVIFTFTNIAGAFGFIYSRILKMKFIVFSYEPHCEFLADLNLWEKNSLKYVLSKKLDYWMGMHGEFIITGTKHMVKRLNDWNSMAQIFRLPTPIDEDSFKFDPEGRLAVRRKFDIENKKVFLYMGKFGDLYYKEEIPLFCKILFEFNTTYFFLIVTSNNHDEIKQLFLDQGLDSKSFIITGNLTNDEVKQYISAADMGISAVPPTPSQKFRSPTKVGEYLCCELPYITVAGVSEDDDYALKYNVGVVLKSFSEKDIKKELNKIDLFFNENTAILGKRCRNTGILYRGKDQAINVFNIVLRDCFKK